MVVIFALLLLYLSLPIVGQIFILSTGAQVSAGEVTGDLIFSNFVFCLIIYLTAYLMQKKAVYTREGGFNLNYERIISRSKLLLIIAGLITFYVGGYKALVLGINRGEIRLTLGAFGFLYNWMVIFFVPALIFLSVLVYKDSTYKKRRDIITIVILGVLCGVSSGYKSTVVFIFLPALSFVFFEKLKIFYLFIIGVIGFLFLVLTTSAVRSVDFFTAYDFLLNRITVMTTYGTIGVWEHFKDGAGFNEASKLMLGLFGNNITSSILGASKDSVEFLSTNLSRKITYLVYPDSYGALKGTVNVTVTSFGEAVYMFGRFYWIYAILSGVVIGLTIRKIRMSYFNCNPILLICSSLYFFIVILTWINSGNVFKLISLPTVFWIVFTGFILQFICFGTVKRK